MLSLRFGPKPHLGSDLFSHSNHGDGEGGDRLVISVLLEVFGALVEHLLNLQHVTTAGICAAYCGVDGKL